MGVRASPRQPSPSQGEAPPSRAAQCLMSMRAAWAGWLPAVAGAGWALVQGKLEEAAFRCLPSAGFRVRAVGRPHLLDEWECPPVSSLSPPAPHPVRGQRSS